MSQQVDSSSVMPLGSGHVAALQRFFADLPDEDVTVVKEDVRDPAMVASAAADTSRARRWVLMAGQDVAGYASLLPGVSLSSHVAEMRIVVSREHRRQGIGRTLARTVLRAALLDGISKVVVEVPAEQEATAEVFRRLGFEGEALLRGHVRGRDGELRDVLVLAHFADENASIMSGLGMDEPH